MTPARSWASGIALAVAACAVSVVATTAFDQRAPFVVSGAVGEQVSSRALTAAAADVRFADRVTVDDWHADGRWIVVTVVASAPQTEVDAVIELATLEVDGQVFQASERPGTSLVRTDLHVGTDTVGMLAFEVPERISDDEGLLRLSTTYATPRLDDLVVLPIFLDDAPTEPSIEIEDSHLGAP
ncbi:hypothetical protein [Microbacterium sp.]|uniref:hypothetical protein n=1 Tax=Microbacterium sp. TaxID=51671 RepID=UPI0026098459|nr:hypothetical protein [Microbacterium sp.]